MTTTVNYGLKKPSITDYINIANFNDNADVIDAKLKDVFDAISDINDNLSNHTHANPTLDELNAQKKITYGTSSPSGGNNGDIYIQY